MVVDAWTGIDLPLLRAIVELEAEGSGGGIIDGGAIQARAGLDLDPEEFTRSVVRLEGGGYIDATIHRGGGGAMSIWVTGALERARRVTRQWPADDSYLALVELLNQQIEEATDEPTKGRLRVVLEGVLGVGRDVGVEVFAEWLTRMSRG
jgi:hypothetical protein